MFVTYARSPSAERAIICAPGSFVGIVPVTTPFMTSTTSSMLSNSAVTSADLPSGSQTRPCGRRWPASAMVRSGVPAAISTSVSVVPGTPGGP